MYLKCIAIEYICQWDICPSDIYALDFCDFTIFHCFLHFSILKLKLFRIQIVILYLQTRYDTPLLVNIKGCGYPPETSCPAFANKYNEIMSTGQTFKCYYSRENPWIVLQEYNYEDTVNKIVASVMIPNVIFAVSLVILLYWYCPYCQARCKKYEDQIDAEDKE